MSKLLIKIPILKIEDRANNFDNTIRNQTLYEIEIIYIKSHNESSEIIYSISETEPLKKAIQDNNFVKDNLIKTDNGESSDFIKEYSFKEETFIFDILKEFERFLKENSLQEYYNLDFLKLKLKISKKFLEDSQENHKEDFYRMMRSDFINTDISNEIFKKLPLDLYRFFIWVLNEETQLKYSSFEMHANGFYNYIIKKELDSEIESFSKIGINQDKQNAPLLIVTLTSFPARINEIHYTIYSLLNQRLKPDKVVLWLAEEQFPNKEEDLPNNLLKLKSNGLTIEWCDDIKSYKKLIPALEKYPKDFLVTADDDIYYHETWLEDMWKVYEKHPNTIISSRTRRIKINSEDEILPYNNWNLINDDSESSYLNLPTGAGGILYFPNALSNKVFEKNLFEEFCPTTDDLWFWAMAVLNKTKITCIDNPFNILKYVNITQELGLINAPTLWLYNKEGNNDKQFNNLLEHFPEIKKIIINEKNKKSLLGDYLMKTEEKFDEEYFNKLDSLLNEKDIILNRNIEYSFILEQEINTLKRKINAKEQETKALKQKINAKEQETKALKQKINAKEQKVKALKQETKTKEKTISKLKNENKLIKSTISWRITKPLRYISKLIK